MGRDRVSVPAKGPRIIDLDLLLMDNLVLNHPGASNTDPGSEAGDEVTPALTLPHPALAQRRVVLAPLAEIAPAMLDPTSGLTIVQLLARLSE
jgi:2-amino-4-hydroxy-6-hydroxymethyldihydropteridine diphosphokinase